MKKYITVHPAYIAELLGTFVLSLFVGVSLVAGLSTAAVAGFAVLLGVYVFGPISGAHFNPAVTIGLWSIKKIGNKDTLGYLISQVLGALLALLILSMSLPYFGGVGSSGIDSSTMLRVIFSEILGMLFFSFGVATMVFRKETTAWNGVVIGGSLTLGVFIATIFGGLGIINPAVSILVLGSSIHAVYFIAPVIGAVLGFQLYRFLVSKN